MYRSLQVGDMSKDIRISRGANIKIKGSAEKILTDVSSVKSCSIKPGIFFNSILKMLVKEGEKVSLGAPICYEKNDPRIIFVSPASGIVKQIIRGERRKILEIIIELNLSNEDKISHKVDNFKSLTPDKIKSLLLESGSWPFIRQRPFNVLADPDILPKSIHISTVSSVPLGVDYEFIVKNNKEDFQLGIDILNTLLPGKVNLFIDKDFGGFFSKVKNVNSFHISGPHPAGNVSVQIQKTDPINYGEKVWVVRPEDVVNIGVLFSTGVYSCQRTIAVSGSPVSNPQYFKTIIGSSLSSFLKKVNIDLTSQNRYINGDIFSGIEVRQDGHIDFYNNLVSIIPEGNNYRFFGWVPFIDNRIPSLSKTSLSCFFGGKGYEVDTNLNGEERALVVTGEMEKVFPMNIYPMQLIKACMAGDIDKMEGLGIYEVVPEDFGLIDYSNTSKIEAQEIIREGIELMIKET